MSATRFRVPVQVWTLAGYGETRGRALAEALKLEARVRVAVAPDDRFTGPAIVILTADDLGGASRAAAREIVERARPGRPVLVGGLENRDTLIDAINEWRVYRAVHQDAGLAELAEAIASAHEVLELEATLQMQADQLRQGNEAIAASIARLSDARERLLNTERLATVGRLTGGLSVAILSHQRSLETFDAALRRDGRDPELTTLLARARAGIESLASLLEEMRAFAEGRERPHAPAPQSLDSLVELVIGFARHDVLGTERRLVSTLHSGATVAAERYVLVHALLNLVRNALQATRAGGRVEIRTRRDATHAFIEIEDNGTGMSSEVRDRIFEPFFSTRGEEGMGLGLRTARAAVERHGGTIACDSRPGAGTRFTVRVPVVAPD